MPNDPIVTCRFPFPEQEPPVQASEACRASCPHFDAERFALHESVSTADPDLLAKLRNFARWLYDASEPSAAIEEQIRYAADLYTRPDHTGTCIPKTLLFAHYKHLQYSSYAPALKLSEAATTALKAQQVQSWPHGEPARGETWNHLFGGYSSGYE